MTTRIEALIDQLVAARPLRPVFVVPGANQASAALDLARTVIRRAERRFIASANAPSPDPTANPRVGAYLNRVSDLLYVLARHAAGDEAEPGSHDATTGAPGAPTR